MTKFSISPEAPHDTTARYEILGEIARGGMGVVYRVKDLDMDRVLAMKVLTHVSKVGQGDAKADYYARFIEEVQITAQLDHPAIVPVHDIGFDQEGTPFYTMRYVKGRHLGDIIALAQQGNEGWTIPRLMDVLLKACQAIAHAHGKGVLHRDLKPTNIMVGDLGEVYVMDWGLARMLGREDIRDIRLELGDERAWETISSIVDGDPAASIDQALMTMDGAVVGTPAYMPPEQAEGKVSEVDHLSDVYALGSILYHMLAGHPPYMPSESSNSAMEILTELRLRPPARILRRDFKLPPELMAICDKAMARDRSERYSSALSLAEELQAFLDGRVVKAHRTGLLIEMRKWVQRNKTTAILTMLAILLGSTGLLWQWQEARNARVIAEIERDDARWQSYRALMMSASNAVQLNQQEQIRSALELAPKEHRNWEWHYFSQALDRSLCSFPISRPPTSASEMAFSAEGWVGLTNSLPRDFPRTIRKVATGELKRFPADQIFNSDLSRAAGYAPDDSIIVTDTQSGKTVLEINRRHDAQVPSFEFANEQDYLILRSNDCIAIWNTHTGKNVEIPRGEYGGPYQILVLAKSRRILVVWEQFLTINDLETGDEISRLKKENIIETVAISPDQSVAVAGERYPERAIQLWKLDDGLGLIGRLEGHKNTVSHLRFDPSGSRLLSCSIDRTARVWDLQSQTEIATLQHRGIVSDIAFNAQGTLAATTAGDGTVRLWDGITGEPLDVMRGHRRAPVVLGFSPTADLLASADGDEIKIWSTGSMSIGVLHGHEESVYDVAISPDGTQAASASWDSTVRIWDLESGMTDRVIPTRGYAIGVTYSPDGRYLAAATRNALVWRDLSTNRQAEKTLNSVHRGGQHLSMTPSFSPDSKCVMIGADRFLRIWNVHTGEMVGEISNDSKFVYDAAFSPDGLQIASANWDGVHLWDASTLVRMAHIVAEKESLYSVTYSPNGDLLAGSGSSRVVLWDTVTHQETAVLPHNGSVYCVAFSPHSDRLFTACDDGLIRIWDLEKFEQVAVLHGHESYVHGVAMSADGSTLISCGGEGSVRLWPIAPAILTK